ncbi:hypothetical protein GA0115233_10415 [Streptomyces sp. DI166]|uniref:hypothetical protein n=1 Tax=Streptomyces sp. DI166 TaxID=1839783 RepID=UPI0007F517CC|nr:hypothetical protein [Streptomyces sp. DI166]SBT92168.1 hypothetical protein GA0115233_10415 [Streptomyces sp. DI166]
MTVTAVLGLFGANAVLSAAPSRQWQPEGTQAGGLLGPLQHGGLRLLFLAVSGVGFSLGAMNVWAVSIADRHGMALLSGVIPSALSVGSLLGGILYGRLRRHGPLGTQLRTAALLFALAWVPLATCPGPIAATALTALPGLFLTALITSAFLTVVALAPADTRTEAYAWLIAAVGTGQAAGTALAGALSTHPYAAALPAAGAFTCLLVLLGARRSLAVSAAARRRGRHRRTPAHAAHR